MSDLDTLRLKVDVQRRLIAMLSLRRVRQTLDAANLLAHQQARGLEWQSVADADERIGIGVYRRQMGRAMDQRDALREQLADRDASARLGVQELDRLRAENERLRGVLRGIRDITHCQGYDSDNDLWDEEPSPCACVNCEARAALGEEVRE